MHVILVIPGIIGSKLKLRSNEIWPPNLFEAITHYRRVKELLTPGLVPTGIIKGVACYPVYRPLTTTLTAIARKMKPQAKVVEFDYDWRMDWRDTAKILSKKLERTAKNGSEISIVGHSMGAMIARLVLEDTSKKRPAWQPQVKRLIAICAPHLGAPHAVADALGLYGMASGIVRPSDTKKIAADKRYPAGYQLFTRPGRPVVFKNGIPLDIYDDSAADSLELERLNLRAARGMFSGFNLEERPPNCDYRFISGNGHKTIESLNTTDLKKFKEHHVDGDGTVPVWSTNPPPAIPAIPTYTMKGEHVGIMKTPQCKALLYQLFGLKAPKDVFMVKEKPLIALSLAKAVFDKRERIDILLIPSKPTRALTGNFKLFRAEDEAARSLTPYGSAMKFESRGLEFESMKGSLKAPSEPGLYKLVFEGSHVTDDETAAYFAVRKETR